jgi:hypothetical protein
MVVKAVIHAGYDCKSGKNPLKTKFYRFYGLDILPVKP